MTNLKTLNKSRHNYKTKVTNDGGYGWIIVGVCFLSTMFADGLIFTYGAFYADLIDIFDDSVSNIMIGGFLLLGFSNVVGPFGAAFVNRFGFKMVMIFGAITSTIAISGSSFIYSIFWFNLIMGFIGGTTLGLVLLGAYTMPPLWFENRRSIACSISYSGVGLGCLLYPLVIEYLINEYSIRGCIFIIGGLNLNSLVFSLLVKEPYSSQVKRVLTIDPVNDEKDYDTAKVITPAKYNNHSLLGILKKIFPPELFKNVSFWIISISAFLITIILFAIPQSIKNYIDVIGFTRIQSATFSMTYGASSLIAKIAVGITVRYIQRSKAVSIISGLCLAVATGLVGIIRNYIYLITYGAILGITGSNIIIMRYVITSEYIPRKYLTSAFGWIFFIQATTLFIALIIAEIGTIYGNYTLSFIVNGIIAFFGSILLLILFCTKKNIV